MRFLIPFLIVFFIPVTFLAQENIAINDLLNEAKSKLYSHPEQTGKIAEYIISQDESNLSHVRATLLLAKSYYVRGNYNDAVKNAMDAKKLSDSRKETAIKIQTNVFALKLFRELEMETVADKYLSNLILLKSKTKEKNIDLYIEGKLEQEDVLLLIEAEDYDRAQIALEKAKDIFLKIDDSTSINEIKLTLAEIYLESGQLDSAEIELEKLQNQVNDFEKLQMLDLFGKIYFDRKQYDKAIISFQEALALSLQFPNQIYENESLKGLTLSYLATEDTQNFFLYKQRSNIASTQIETNKNLAVNSVYNFINSYQKEKSENEIHQSQIFIYILVALLIVLLISGGIFIYVYRAKTKEYLIIYKYIVPKETKTIPVKKVEDLQKSSIVPEEIEQLLLHKLEKFESGKKYTNPDMSIAVLAGQFDTNTKYLSEVINRQKGKNFNAYINELRINYIIGKLKTDPIYFNYKVSYLAEESGFSSHSSFATVFKSVTGISPTKFMDFLQKRKETA